MDVIDLFVYYYFVVVIVVLVEMLLQLVNLVTVHHTWIVHYVLQRYYLDVSHVNRVPHRNMVKLTKQNLENLNTYFHPVV
eukprot:UN06923